MSPERIRDAITDDLGEIARIWNEGILDRVATLDEDPKDAADVAQWFAEHGGRYAVLVAESADGRLVGWCSLNRYSHRCAYDGVADRSIYIERSARGRGIGTLLLSALEARASSADFRKIVLFALATNAAGAALYRKGGYREVGIFREQGRLDGVPTDVLAMEKML